MTTLKLAGLEPNVLTVTTKIGITVEAYPTADRVNPKIEAVSSTVSFDTTGYPQKESKIFWKQGTTITDSMITRADTGGIIIIEDEIYDPNHGYDRVYLGSKGAMGQIILEIDAEFDTCITFNLSNVVGATSRENYFVCYRPDGSSDKFRIQRFSRQYSSESSEIRKIGLKLFKNNNLDAYSTANNNSPIEIEVYAIDGTEYYEHLNLKRLKPV